MLNHTRKLVLVAASLRDDIIKDFPVPGPNNRLVILCVRL